ncbi:hypothetical protein [Rhodococcus sp. IEGM 1408]|uniref:hypothetical protein n=1 Tax=Rhodococcus sp. IEGM 1408 TaxID=3082220 RepID=UPI002954AAF8|nr:hypothetical protein [Rhodococcus sp. IEGM 1408]MDV7999708.1 hypothetical protein [Rhodococcus sp. IEGM 1408]
MSATSAGPARALADPRAQPGVAVAVDAGVAVVVTALLLGGLARPGFPLLRDWVATPTPPLSDAALGRGESAARAVPQDVAVAWATRALGTVGLPVWPLTGLLTAVFCVWLAVAAGALVRRVVQVAGGPSADAPGWAGHLLRLPAVVGAVWNPLVVERLLQGHWSLVAGMAAVVTMPLLLARARPRVAAACAAVAAAGLTPTGWVLAVVAGAVSLWCAGSGPERPGSRSGSGSETESRPGRGRRLRSAVPFAAVAVVTALPWLLATVLAGTPTAGAGAGAGADTGVTAFAARAETGIGTLGSVVALGGIWNSAAVPPSRATWWAGVALALLLVVWALAAPGLLRARRHPVVRATVPLALVTWLLVALAATGPGLTALDTLVGAVPAAGLLRDTQKLVALALPATVLALGFAARALAPRLRPVGAALAITAVAVAAVPDAPRALWDALRPVTYGDGWAQVAGIVAEQGGDKPSGDLLMLPAGSFRSTPLWAGGAAVLDPAPRLLDARVLVPGDLVVGRSGAVGGSSPVAGEGGRARQATEALLSGADPRALTDLGVRWVLDERTSAGPRGESDRTLESTTTRFTDPELVLYELAPPDGRTWRSPDAAPPAAGAASRAAVLVAHAAWLVTGLAAGLTAGLAAGVPALRRVRRRPRD